MAIGRGLHAAVESAPQLRAPKTLAAAAFRSSSLGHDLIHRLQAERFELFLSGHLALWAGAGILLPLWEYFWLLRSPRFWPSSPSVRRSASCSPLATTGPTRSVPAVDQRDFGRHVGQRVGGHAHLSASASGDGLAAMVPVVFAEPYISLQRGLLFTVITAACVLAMATLARFTQLPDAVVQATRWIETAFIVIAVPLNVPTSW